MSSMTNKAKPLGFQNLHFTVVEIRRMLRGGKVTISWFRDNNGVFIQPLFPRDLTCHCHTLAGQIKLKMNQVSKSKKAFSITVSGPELIILILKAKLKGKMMNLML